MKSDLEVFCNIVEDKIFNAHVTTAKGTFGWS